MIPVANSLLPKHAGQVCPYCSEAMSDSWYEQPTRDHVVPKSRGGALGVSNIVIVCRRCNLDKTDMLLSEFYGWLRQRSDPRADVLEASIHDACSHDSEVMAEFYSEAGLWLARHNPKSRTIRRLLQARDRVWSVMRQLNVPSTHWAFWPPDQIKLIARSRINIVSCRDPHKFVDEVSELLGVAA